MIKDTQCKEPLMDSDNVESQQEYANHKTFPLAKLLLLSMTGFIAIMTETMPAGILPLISKDLGVSESLSGQLITLYALGSVLAAVPVITATAHWPRKRLLLFSILGFFIFNLVTAISSNYILTLFVRFLGGVSAGVAWAILIGFAKRIVQPSHEGKAITIVGMGQPLALAFGVPLCTWISLYLGWAGAFWIISGISLFLLVFTYLSIPDFKGIESKKKVSPRFVLGMKGVLITLVAIFLWIFAHNMLYTYMSPFLAIYRLADKIDVFMLLFGCSSLLGIAITGALIDKFLKSLILFNLLLFAFSALVMMGGDHSTYWVYIGVFVWGTSFGGAPSLLQKQLVDASGEYADIAQSMLVTVFNSAVAMGGIGGAFVLVYFNAISIPMSLVIISLLILVIFMLEKLSIKKT
ncbi:MFS transporter [Chryseobacterium sp. Marseille-Q3244]|uniref:MFS transporter n=1 Tax=Chryseobacterium sp. Marseille-Q3244 TaxID=2758092 RepID=UPI002025A0D0|nr:MFS transporter [Chryseobacterium sp. Marseille-Q3244]